MRLNIILKTVFFSVTALFLFAKTYSQITNNGSIISITSSAVVYSKSSIVNNSRGNIINNGSITTDSSLTNNSGSSLSGNGTYVMRSDFTNNGNFNAGTSTLEFVGNDYSFIKNTTGKIYNLVLNKATNKYASIHDNEQVIKNVNFLKDGNYLRLNANTLTLAASCTVTNYSDKRYFITNDTGSLKKLSVGRTGFVFPVGFDNSTYNPVTVTENGTIDDYVVRCLQTALTKGSTGTAITKNGINTSWYINQGVAGGANATINVQWKTADELTGFNAAKCMVTRYTGSAWDFNSAAATAATVGTTYKNISRSSLTSFGYFTVLSSTQTMLASIAEELDAEPRIYPTIVRNSFHINIPFIKDVQKMNVMVIDESGKIVWQKQNADFQSQQITLPTLASGMYTVLLNYADKKFAQKIIVNQ